MRTVRQMSLVSWRLKGSTRRQSEFNHMEGNVNVYRILAWNTEESKSREIQLHNGTENLTFIFHVYCKRA
jgi:hypothetical protein